MMFRLRLMCLVAAALACAPAAAQDRSGAAIAEKLFADGRAAMLAGRFDEACPKLAESQRLDPGVGTLLNLGECYERWGKTASAWATYREAEVAARRASQRERAQFAASHVEALGGKLSYLTVSVSEPIADLELRRNGERIGRAVWGTALPVDPGPQVLEASAPARQTWRSRVEVAGGAKVSVTVPALAREQIQPAEPLAPERAKPSGAFQRVLGWSLVGTGAVAVGVGAAFGLVARSKNSEARGEHCSAVDCDPRGVTLLHDAKNAATVSTILFAAGAVSAAAGVIFVVTAPHGDDKRAARVWISPAGVSVGGAF